MMANAPADVTMTGTARADRLLTAAADTMAKVADCGAAAPSENGGVNVRVVGPIPGVPGEEDWTIWFVTRRSSRKAADIQRAGLLTLGYQHHPDRAWARSQVVTTADNINPRAAMVTAMKGSSP